MTRLIRGLTLTHPWAWAIAHLGKTVENRVWSPAKAGGRTGMLLAIHGGRPPRPGRGKPYLDAVAAWAWIRRDIIDAGHLTPEAARYLAGVMKPLEDGTYVVPDEVTMRPGIVAVATLAGVSTTSRSPWAARGQYHWLLTDVTPIEPVQDDGPNHRGLWALQPDVETLVLARYDDARRAA